MDESLPPQVREILEKAEKFEVLAEVGEREMSEPELMNFQPNRSADVDKNIKKKILETFYIDAATNESGTSRYEPHHGLRASYRQKTVDIKICFDCAKFLCGKFTWEF